MRDHQDPLEQPQPAAELVVELPFDSQRIHRWCGVLSHGTHFLSYTRGRRRRTIQVSRGSPALLRERAAIEAGRK